MNAATMNSPNASFGASNTVSANTTAGTIANTLFLAFFAGSVATVAFDLWGSVISPALGFAKLSPVSLGTQTVKVLTGIDTPIAGSFMHLFLVGLIAYPLGYLSVFRPLQRKFAAGLPWLASSVIYGTALFVAAIGIIAGPWIAGNPWFLNWAPITWVSLVGHVLYGVVLVAAVGALERRAA